MEADNFYAVNWYKDDIHMYHYQKNNKINYEIGLNYRIDVRAFFIFFHELIEVRYNIINIADNITWDG